MQYLKAGKFIKEKRKGRGFNTQKSFIQALETTAPDIHCSESYISLIEAGEKSPSVQLLDVIASVLNLSHQEKGELLLIYKRVPEDLTFAVKSNLRESLKVSNLDILKKQYEKNKTRENFNKLVRAFVIEEKTDEAIDLLKSPPDDFIEYQARIAQMAVLSGNYEFALQAFNLALQSCTADMVETKSNLLMNIGICYFTKALRHQYDKPAETLEFLLNSDEYLVKSLGIISDSIYCLDEHARCLYHIGDTLNYFYKNNLAPDTDNIDFPKTRELFKEQSENDLNSFIYNNMQDNFQKSLSAYQKILSHSRKIDLPEKALKEAVYFHAYIQGKLGMFDQCLIWLNSINIMDQNWLTFFLKTGYAIMRYEKEGQAELIEEAIDNLRIAFKYDADAVKTLIKLEKNRELKTLWTLKEKELNKILKEKESD